MARWVKLTVVYDMDDDEKALYAERADWIEGKVTVADVILGDAGDAILTEVTQEEARELLGEDWWNGN